MRKLGISRRSYKGRASATPTCVILVHISQVPWEILVQDRDYSASQPPSHCTKTSPLAHA